MCSIYRCFLFVISSIKIRMRNWRANIFLLPYKLWVKRKTRRQIEELDIFDCWYETRFEWMSVRTQTSCEKMFHFNVTISRRKRVEFTPSCLKQIEKLILFLHLSSIELLRKCNWTSIFSKGLFLIGLSFAMKFVESKFDDDPIKSQIDAGKHWLRQKFKPKFSC